MLKELWLIILSSSSYLGGLVDFGIFSDGRLFDLWNGSFAHYGGGAVQG